MEKIKYARTYHLPWSFSETPDDKRFTEAEIKQYFYPLEDVYVSTKMDGENTTIGKGYSHARSLDSKNHWSREHIKALAARLYNDIPEGWRICGENMMAKHSIKYKNLESYFYVFSIWDENNMKLELDDALEFCEILDLKHVPILKRGSFRSISFSKSYLGFDLDYDLDEGYVVCNAKSFHWDDFKKNIAKCVRANHVITDDDHWTKNFERNLLA